MWALAWLMVGGLTGFIVAALIAAGARADLLREVVALRAMEDDFNRLELRVAVPAGDLFRAPLADMRLMWKWSAENGRWSLFGGNVGGGDFGELHGVVIVVDEIGVRH